MRPRARGAWPAAEILARIGLLSTWASRLGGGVFEAVVAQAFLLRDLGHDPVVFALADEHSAADRQRFDGIDVRTHAVRGPGAIGFAPTLADDLIASKLDLVHLHGIWMYPSRAGSTWARRTGRPYLISPHGMLDPWITARGRAKKTVARIGYERASWTCAAAFHALTEAEAADIRRETGRDAVRVVPNPVLPPAAPPPPASSAPPNVLALGRIHPKKNLDGLIRGWTASPAPAAGWTLTIAGWGDATHVAELEAQIAAAAAPSIRFVGPLFGTEKAAAFANMRAFALPSHSEGLPMAILEAWAAGRPTLMSRACHLDEGFAAGAALDSGTDPERIAAAIARLCAMDAAALDAMGDAARALVAERFAPDIVAARWRRVYDEALA